MVHVDYNYTTTVVCNLLGMTGEQFNLQAQ